jgi:microcystin-dependent protein
MSRMCLDAVMGNIYGGDGRTTFALPDLRGRTPVEAGSDRQGFEPCFQDSDQDLDEVTPARSTPAGDL